MESLRAVVLQFNTYDVQSGIYNVITVLFEMSSARLLQGSEIEILPFFVPNSDLENSVSSLFVFL